MMSARAGKREERSLGKQLPKAPLVEALLEIRWELNSDDSGSIEGGEFSLFLGRFFEKIKNDYRFPEKLPSASMPDQITENIVKYRFRASAGGWPLVQAGPGIVALNFTTKVYTWSRFRKAALKLWLAVQESLALDGVAKSVRIESALLRYINAVVIDPAEIETFLRDRLHVVLDLPGAIRETAGDGADTTGLRVNVSFGIERLPGQGMIQIGTGIHENQHAIVFEELIRSVGDDTPQSKKEFEKWLDEGHMVAESWFLELVRGDLLKDFGG